MLLCDLGALEGPVLVFGGPYSNLQATRAVLGRARGMGLPCGRVICTGDVVAYGGQPAETVAEIRRFGGPVVAGNCERQLAARAPDCGCGFEAGTLCDRLSAAWYAHADAALGAADRAWMAELPDMLLFRHGGRRCAVIHGGATDVSRFVWPSAPERVFAEEIAAIRAAAGPVEMVIAGHCGLAFRRRVAGVTWLNAGAVGLPPNDGRPATRYAVLRAGRGEIHTLSCDHRAAAEAMRAAGLTQGYDDAVESGYWPSEEVLPPELRRAARASG